jgi:cation diffusion facilitator family transporter
MKDTDPASPAARSAVGAFAGWVGIGCNALLVAAKLMVGLMAGSVSVVADAFNNLSDMLGSLVTLVGFKLAARRADPEHPFGHGRYEYIAALSVAVFIVVVGVELGRDSIARLLNPEPVSFSTGGLLLLFVSALLKVALGLFYRGLAQKYSAPSLRASSADSFNDVIATGAVLVGAILSRFAGVNIDGWLGLAVGAFIVWSGIGLVRDALSPLLGESPDPELVRRMVDTIKSHEEIISMHDLIIHDYGPERRFASAHVEISGALSAQEAHGVIDAIEREVLRQEGVHLLLHLDPVSTDAELGKVRARIQQGVKSVDERLSVHDVHIELSDCVTYYFDVTVPPECTLPADELKEKIRRAVETASPEPVKTVIHIDRFYTTF